MTNANRWLVIVLIAAYMASTAFLYKALNDTSQAQIANRARNVQSWCNGINAGRNYDRAFVSRVSHGRLHYTLPDLPCNALVAKTLKSAQH